MATPTTATPAIDTEENVVSNLNSLGMATLVTAYNRSTRAVTFADVAPQDDLDTVLWFLQSNLDLALS